LVLFAFRRRLLQTLELYGEKVRLFKPPKKPTEVTIGLVFSFLFFSFFFVSLSFAVHRTQMPRKIGSKHMLRIPQEFDLYGMFPLFVVRIGNFQIFSQSPNWVSFATTWSII
jgi:hypothetical protein